MGGFPLVIILAAFAVAFLINTLWTRVSRLTVRVEALERALSRQESGEPAPDHAPPAEIAPAEAPEQPLRAEPARPDVKTPPPTPVETPVAPQGREPRKAIVLRADKLRAAAGWLRENIIYVVSAVSLALAGVFLVQYGAERGLVSPTMRVGFALAFGVVLVVAGEILRRRWGDRGATRFLPSVFSGAGIIVLFGAVLAALHLYALISPGAALAGLIAVAALAVALGWYSGPLLAGLGVVGANAAPFVVGGSSDTPEALFAYFLVVAVMGLAIDAGKRWAWVSVLALVSGYVTTSVLQASIGEDILFAGTLLALTAAALVVPMWSLTLRHAGPSVAEAVWTRGRDGYPEFPTRLAAGAMLAVAGLLLAFLADSGPGFWPALIVFSALFAWIALGGRQAPALEDLAGVAAGSVVGLVALHGAVAAPVWAAFHAPEAETIPNTPYHLLALSAALALVAAWRSRAGARWPVIWAAGAALLPPAMLAALETTWAPVPWLGAYPWALAAMAVAAMMTALAGVFARLDGESRARVSGFALAALGLTTYALSIVLSDIALTLAFAAVTLAAAALDARFRLPALGWAVQAGTVLIGWRLLVDPGLFWAMKAASYGEMTLAFGGSVLALAGAMALLRPLGRGLAVAVAESGAWTFAAVFASLLLLRLIGDFAWPGTEDSHWAFGLFATVWLAASAGQLWRARCGGRAAWLRWLLAGGYGALGGLALVVAATLLNPVVYGEVDNSVLGPPLVNTLLPAYLLPAALLGFVAWRFTFLPRLLRGALAVTAAVLTTLWAALAIRHFWQGGMAMDAPTISAPELYSYTLALLATGAALLIRAIARRSDGLRKLAMAVIAVTVAKVFLVDASGLVGLLRVFSFLALGLALAGLAFLNRWAAGRTGD